MKRSALVFLTLILAVTGSAMAADSWGIDKAHSDVSFNIRHLMSKVTGRFGEFDGKITADFQNLSGSSVEFTIKAASIDTANEDRDKHLRSADFFDVENYPEITFKSSKITKMDDNSFAVTGTFTMHGVSKTITIPVTYLGEIVDPWGKTKAGYELSTTLNRKDYGISWNKTLDAGSLILGDEVEISINLQLEKK
jgi:polyisoprenoid-binding protein YceI